MYTIYDPQVSEPLHKLSRKEAQKHFDLHISMIESRIEELSLLLSESKIKLDGSSESLKKLCQWFNEIADSQEKAGDPTPFTFSVCISLRKWHLWHCFDVRMLHGQ